MLKSKLPRLIFILWNLLNESIVEMKLSIIALDQIQGHHKVRLANHKSNIIVSSNVQTMVNHKKLCMKTCSEAIVTREPELQCKLQFSAVSKRKENSENNKGMSTFL